MSTTQAPAPKLTNVGTKPLTVAAGTRGFRTVASSQRSVAFDSTTLPTFTYYNGQTWAYKKVTFTVPAGTQRLLERMAFQATGPSDIVRLTLLDPSGRFVANSRPQGGTATANYANVDVRKPVAGTWTAILYSIAGPGGYHSAPIILRSDAQKAIPVGRVSPAVFTLAPHRSRTVTATTRPPEVCGSVSSARSTSVAGPQSTISCT